MAKRILSMRGGLLFAALILLTAGALVWSAKSSSSNTGGNPVQWNAGTAKDLAAEFHRLHTVWNEGDFVTVKKLIAGDDVLATFEIGDDQKPVALKSKKDIDAFFDGIIKNAADERGTYTLDMPEMNCRATENFGVCTEVCTIHYKVGNTERIDHFFGTGVAVKHADGWKWIQYHISVAAPSNNYKNGKPAE